MSSYFSLRSFGERFTAALVLCLPLLAGCSNRMEAHPVDPNLARNTLDAVLKGGQPEVNNTTDYENGNKVVPSYLLQPVIVDKDNYRKELVDTGYYTASQLG